MDMDMDMEEQDMDMDMDMAHVEEEIVRSALPGRGCAQSEGVTLSQHGPVHEGTVPPRQPGWSRSISSPSRQSHLPRSVSPSGQDSKCTRREIDATCTCRQGSKRTRQEVDAVNELIVESLPK